MGVAKRPDGRRGEEAIPNSSNHYGQNAPEGRRRACPSAEELSEEGEEHGLEGASHGRSLISSDQDTG